MFLAFTAYMTYIAYASGYFKFLAFAVTLGRMAKAKGETVKDRYWWRGPASTRKAMTILAAHLDTTAEKMAGEILTAVVAQTHGDPDALRKLLGRK